MLVFKMQQQTDPVFVRAAASASLTDLIVRYTPLVRDISSCLFVCDFRSTRFYVKDANWN